MPDKVRVLIVEDDAADAALVRREIRKSGIDFEDRLVETRETFLEALEAFRPDLILCDYRLPRFDGMQALAITRERAPQVPFIIITGAINEEVAVECMKAGAADYILKDRLSRTGPAAQAALEQAAVRRAKREAEEALRLSEERYRRLAGHLEDLREGERSAMAREIHDELGQALTALRMETSWLARQVADPAQVARAREMLLLIDDTIAVVQHLCAELRPALLDDFGLAAAVEWQVREFERRSDIPCSLHIAYPEGSLDRHGETALFRILQEALTNIARHAGAHALQVQLQVAGEAVRLAVADDGLGIPEEALRAARSFGLQGMEERARACGGAVRIGRHEGGGTLVEAEIPRPAAGGGT